MNSRAREIALLKNAYKLLGFNAAAGQADWIYRNGDMRFIAPALRKLIQRG
jgi:hypothetical protein